MNRNILIVLISFSMYSCKNSKDKTEVIVGETFEILYTTNSCCSYCIVHEKELKHVKLLERKIINNGDKTCVGCNYEVVFVFKALAIGIETIEFRNVEATVDCNSSSSISKKHIVKIKSNI